MNVTSSASLASSPSRTSTPARRWLREVGWLRFAAGPFALAGFFLPWASGLGALSGTQFSGFTLVGFAGRLQALDLSLAAGGTLWILRFAILGVAIAGAWQTVLAPRGRRHFAYPLSGWYLALAAVACIGIGAARSGLALPPAGLACLAAAGLCFAIPTLLDRRTSAKPRTTG